MQQPQKDQPMKQTIVLVDDDRNILTSVSMTLEQEGFQVRTYTDGESALHALAARPADLAVLDIKMPRMDWMELLQRLRARSAMPVIFLTSKDEEVDELMGLRLGADDYITKPFGVEELLARMRAAVRRTRPAEDLPRIQLGQLVIDLAAKRVTRQAPVPAGAGTDAGTDAGAAAAAADIRLTPTEWHLLEVLLRNPGKLLTRNQLLTEVWGPGYADATGNLRLYMAQLRRKLEPDSARPRWLITEPGMGYRYQPSPDAGTP